MGNFLNETTLEYVRSGNDPDYSFPPWIGPNVDLTQVDGVPKKYWKLESPLGTPTNRPIEMTQGEKDVVDAAEAAALVSDNRAETIAELSDVSTHLGWRLRELIELFNKRDNYLVNRIIELQSALDAMKASSGNVGNLRDAIPASWLASSTRSRADAVQDFIDDVNAGGADV